MGQERGSQGLFGTVGAWGQPEQGGEAPGQTDMGLADPLRTRLLGGGEAGSEVFPGHQATRVSPGGCNSSSAPVPLSGPAPGACYCRCGAPSPLACPCPLPTPATPTRSSSGVPQQCPCSVLPGTPCLFPCKLSPHSSWFLSLHPGVVPTTRSPWCKAASMARSPPHKATNKILGGFGH